jgi:hypothetical protein
MNYLKSALLLCVLLVGVMTGYGQQLPANAPTRQQVLKLFEATQLRRTMEASQEVAMQTAVNTVQQMIRQSGAALDAEMQRQMDGLMKGVMEDVRAVLSTDEMLEAVIPIYQRHYTAEEVEAIIAFQNSPVGKKMVSLQPMMMQESAQALAPLQQRAMPELMRRLNERMQKIVPPAPAQAPTPGNQATQRP